MNKRHILIILVLIAVAAGLYAWRHNGREDPNRIVLSGNIEMTDVNVAFKAGGKLVERTVTEGDPVKKGQVIARLDRDQLLRQREREEAGLRSAQSLLAQAETALRWQRATVAADIEQKRADL